MRREKIIIVAFLIVLGIVFIETFFMFFPRPIKNTSEKHTRINAQLEEIKKKKVKSKPPTLNVSGWSKDIFYDRSSIYDHRFSLTGIIEFDNERKVIINEKILRVGEKEKGFTVADISVNQVLLTKNKHQVTLNLEQ